MAHQLPVMEMFYSLQGEGAYVGTPAYFIRLGGCDIGCHWCDVKESWEAARHPIMSVDEIIKKVPPEVHYVIITGGEPCMYNLTELTSKLKSRKIHVNLETSGAHEIIGSFDWICVSPKRRASPIPSSLEKAHELKIIVYNRADFKLAQYFAEKVSKKCKKYLQVEWGKRNELTKAVIDYALKNPIWRVSTQTHKYLNIR